MPDRQGITHPEIRAAVSAGRCQNELTADPLGCGNRHGDPVAVLHSLRSCPEGRRTEPLDPARIRDRQWLVQDRRAPQGGGRRIKVELDPATLNVVEMEFYSLSGNASLLAATVDDAKP